MRLTPDGKREIIVGGAILFAAAAACAIWFWYLLPVPILIFAWLLAFFRDPQRDVPTEPGVLVAPADGRVVEINEVQDGEFLNEPALRIGIFLSIFNCHVNRAPGAGIVRHLRRRSGGFRLAWKADASTANESNDIGLELTTTDGQPAGRILARQITGAIARRIVCHCREAQTVARGERIGMIKFGSRAELLVPKRLGFRPRVKVGDRVRAGETIMGEFA